MKTGECKGTSLWCYTIQQHPSSLMESCQGERHYPLQLMLTESVGNSNIQTVEVINDKCSWEVNPWVQGKDSWTIYFINLYQLLYHYFLLKCSSNLTASPSLTASAASWHSDVLVRSTDGWCGKNRCKWFIPSVIPGLVQSHIEITTLWLTSNMLVAYW